MAYFKPVRIAQSQLSTWSDSQGQLIFAYDTGRVFLVTQQGRIQQGITNISDSSQLPELPVNKLYFIRDTGKLFYFTDRWIDVSKNFGFKDVLNGYSARIKSVSGTTINMLSDSSFVDMSKFTVGSVVYTNLIQSQSGDDQWLHRTITGVSGYTLTVDKAITTTTTGMGYDASDAAAGAYVLNVADLTDIPGMDDALAFGGKNFSTGIRSTVFGTWNTAAGTATTVFGGSNIATGNFDFVSGVSNVVTAQSDIVIGVSNRVRQLQAYVIGDGNTINAQGAVVFGNTFTVQGIGSVAIGHTGAVNGYGSICIGSNVNSYAQTAICIGATLTNRAKEATILGVRGQLADTAQNRGAVAFAGGSGLNAGKAISFIHRVNRAQLNPSYDASKDPNHTGKDSNNQPQYNSIPGYRTSYRGCLRPQTQTVAISSSTVVDLDPTMYSRVILTGSGEAVLQAVDYFQDGDSVQVVVDTDDVSVQFPAQWVGDPSVLVQQPGLHVLQITNHTGTIFYRSLYARCQLKWTQA